MTAFGPKMHNRADLLKTLQKAIIQKGGVPFLKKLLKTGKKSKKRVNKQNNTCEVSEVPRIRQPSQKQSKRGLGSQVRIP